jgi:transposase
LESRTQKRGDKVIKSIATAGAELRFIYEAGPCGYALYRYLSGNGFTCIVTSPAMIPKRNSVRIKNDRRDALKLARLYRAGELTGIYVPDPEDEAIRDLTRAREDARLAERRAKQRVISFLLRHNFIYPGKKPWTKTYFVWLGKVGMQYPAQKIALQEYIEAVHECTERLARLSEQISLAVEVSGGATLQKQAMAMSAECLWKVHGHINITHVSPAT